MAAEIEANADTFERYGDLARAQGAVILPAMAFFGGLGDLLATTAMGDWTRADEARVVYGLSGWHPTPGTRVAGKVSSERREGRRVRHTGGRLEYHRDELGLLDWEFPAPLGRRTVVDEFTMADVVTLPSHLDIPEVRTAMALEAARDLASPDTPAPTAVDERGRSAQTFVVDVVVRSGTGERRAVAHGRDIYAVTAPLVVEAVERILTGRTSATGVVSARRPLRRPRPPARALGAPDGRGERAGRLQRELARRGPDGSRGPPRAATRTAVQRPAPDTPTRSNGRGPTGRGGVR